MDIASAFIGMGRAAEIFREDMSIEEAAKILDPLNERKFSERVEEQMEISARDLKARSVLVQYVKKKISKDTVQPKQEKDKNKLRPCPFCGAKLELKKGWYPRDNSDAYVHPDNGCILSNFSTFNGFPTEGKDVELWNKRHTDND